MFQVLETAFSFSNLSKSINLGCYAGQLSSLRRGLYLDDLISFMSVNEIITSAFFYLRMVCIILSIFTGTPMITQSTTFRLHELCR
jgi:hypothetical protein